MLDCLKLRPALAAPAGALGVRPRQNMACWPRAGRQYQAEGDAGPIENLQLLHSHASLSPVDDGLV
jgi:hypothetical protein